MPSEFMDVNYGAAVKGYLTDKVTFLRAHRFDPENVQFGDALVSLLELVFRKTPPTAAHAVEFTYGGTLPPARRSIFTCRVKARNARQLNHSFREVPPWN